MRASSTRLQTHTHAQTHSLATVIATASRVAQPRATTCKRPGGRADPVHTELVHSECCQASGEQISAHPPKTQMQTDICMANKQAAREKGEGGGAIEEGRGAGLTAGYTHTRVRGLSQVPLMPSLPRDAHARSITDSQGGDGLETHPPRLH